MLSVVWLQIVNWVSLPVLLVVAVRVLSRKTHRSFPYFFSYVVILEGVGFARLFVFYFARYAAYFYTYWVSDFLISVFTFLVAYELFIRRVFPRFYAVRLYRYLFPIAGLAIVGLAVPVALAYRKLSLLLTFIHGLEILRTTLLLFFIGLMVLMGRRWMRYEFGIALGLGLQASADLISSAAVARFWRANLHLFGQLPLFAFDVACLVWLITFLKSEQPEPASSPSIGHGILDQARIWEHGLKESLRADSETVP